MEGHLHSAMKAVGQAIKLDGNGNSREAYFRYLACIQYISQVLIEEAKNQGYQGAVKTKSTERMVKLAQQCMDRTSAIMELTAEGQTAQLAPPSNSTSGRFSPSISFNSSQTLQSKTVIQPKPVQPYKPPSAFGLVPHHTEHSSSACQNMATTLPVPVGYKRPPTRNDKLTPLEAAYLENRRLISAYQARLANLIDTGRGRGKHNKTNLLNHCVIDLSLTVIITLKILIPFPRHLKEELASELICRLWVSNWTVGTLMIISTVNFMLMTVERYCAFCYPVKHRLWFTNGHKAKLLICFAWISSFCIGSLSVTTIHFNAQKESCDFISGSTIMIVVVFTLAAVYEIIIPTATIIFFILIFIRLCRLGKTSGVVHGAALRQAKYSLLLTIFISFIISMAVQLPAISTILLNSLGAEMFGLVVVFIKDWIVVFLILKNLSTSMVYTIANKRFRVKLLALLCKIKRKVTKNKTQVLPLDTL